MATTLPVKKGFMATTLRAKKSFMVTTLLMKKRFMRLPHACAFVAEVLRHACPVAFGIPHRTETPHTVHGYRVPRDTVIIYGILAGHWDGTLWSQPEQFRPERFLREDGAFAAGDKFVPYGVGPRRCPGRRLADALALGVVTRLVRQFELTPPDGAPPPPEEVAVVLTRRCGPFQAHFRPR
ncbi:steroid 21-hydroxylase-like [Pollicipes pollicipes]|uniref:steroid 21-hydroxylase-like n=1 Tax=Pollicipes pollicipes TaxID=41117 RepID=UPI0018850280|nr:steroid 21-hydroxylase-like [Pollicipes pollicipes]